MYTQHLGRDLWAGLLVHVCVTEVVNLCHYIGVEWVLTILVVRLLLQNQSQYSDPGNSGFIEALRGR